MDELSKILRDFKKLAIIGIGSELRKDDGIGLYIIQKLKVKIQNDRVEILEGGTTPENLSGVLRKIQPSHILMIDAAKMGKEPGDYAIVDPETVKGIGFSTHTFSLGKIAAYFKEITGAEIVFLGIEPKEIDFGEGLSGEVLGAAAKISDQLEAALA